VPADMPAAAAEVAGADGRPMFAMADATFERGTTLANI